MCDFHAQICFHSHFFTAHTSLKMSDRKAIRSQNRDIAAHMFKVIKEQAMNGHLYHYQSIEKEPAYQPEHYHASGKHEDVQPDTVNATSLVPSSEQAPKF